MAKSWDYDLNLDQRGGILRVTLGAFLLLAGFVSLYGYFEVELIAGNLFVLALGLSLILASLFSSISGVWILLGMKSKLVQTRNGSEL